MKKIMDKWEKLKKIIKEEIKENEENYDKSYFAIFQNFATAEKWILKEMEKLEKAD